MALGNPRGRCQTGLIFTMCDEGRIPRIELDGRRGVRSNLRGATSIFIGDFGLWVLPYSQFSPDREATDSFPLTH